MCRRVVFALALGLASVLSAPSQAAQGVVSLRADFWCPFNCHPDSDRPGLLIEIAQRAFGAEQVDYQLMNWARAVEATRLGSYAAIVGAFSGDAPDFVFPDVALSHTRNCFYVADTDWRYQGVQSLRRVRLGVGNGYDYGRRMAAYIAEHQQRLDRLVIASGDYPTSRNIELLQRGRIDALIESEDVMSYLLAEQRVEGISKAGCLEEATPMFIAFSPNNRHSQALVEQLSRTVRELKDSGEMAELRRRYGLIEDSPPQL